MIINLPINVQAILNKLEENGFKGYVVGGCVRDSILRKTPKDWDITTDANPQQIMDIFDHVSPTGLKHGTVTVIVEKEGYEITTFRTEGKYSDGRRPDEVKFCKELKDDLSRRDFTINAMAYNPNEGLIDPFNGQIDLDFKLIRCVGNPHERFSEDGLRILRAFRFKAQLGFELNGTMWNAILRSIDTLDNISKERMRDEFLKIVKSNHKVIRDLIDTGVMAKVIPDFDGMVGFAYSSYNQAHTLFEHTMLTVDLIEDDLTLKLAMLFHDIGKLHCRTIDENGNYYFYTHNKISKIIAETIMSDLRFENKIRNKVLTLIDYQNLELNNSIDIKKCLGKIGVELTKDLIKVKWADALASDLKDSKRKLVKLCAIEKILNNIIKSGECYSLKQLEINGSDLLDIGFKGERVGEILQILLDKVIHHTHINDKDLLIVYAKKIFMDEGK